MKNIKRINFLFIYVLLFLFLSATITVYGENTSSAKSAVNNTKHMKCRKRADLMTEAAKAAENEYYRKWRKANKEKVKQYQATYWARKAKKAAAEEAKGE